MAEQRTLLATPGTDLVRHEVPLANGLSVYVYAPKDATPQMISALAAKAPQPSAGLSEHQLAGADLGGVVGGIGVPALMGLLGGGPVGMALGGVLGSVVGGGAGAKLTGASNTQAANEAVWQGLLSGPGEMVAALKAPLKRLGRTIDRRALNPSDTVLKQVHIPGNTHPTMQQAEEYLYDQARQLPGMGIFGTKHTAEANQAAKEALKQRVALSLQQSTATADPKALLDAAVPAATSQGHALGNYPDMMQAVESVYAKSMQDPLLGHDVPVQKLQWNLPNGMSQADFQAMPVSVQTQLQAQGIGQIPITVMERQFKPHVPVADLHAVKTQTYDDLRNAYLRGAERGEPNINTVQKAGAHEITQALNTSVPGYEAANREYSIRIPLQEALETANKASTRGLNRYELLTMGGLGTGAALAGMSTPGIIASGLLGLAGRPSVESALGRGIMRGSSLLPAVGRGAVGGASRLADFLVRRPEEGK